MERLHLYLVSIVTGPILWIVGMAMAEHYETDKTAGAAYLVVAILGTPIGSLALLGLVIIGYLLFGPERRKTLVDLLAWALTAAALALVLTTQLFLVASLLFVGAVLTVLFRLIDDSISNKARS